MTPEQIYELIELLRTIAEDLAKIRASLDPRDQLQPLRVQVVELLV